MRRPEFSQFVTAKKAEISAQYPSWKHAFGDGIAHGAAIDLEIQERLYNPRGEEDRYLGEFHSRYNRLTEVLSAVGLSMNNPEEIPPEVYVAVRAMAREMAQREPKFKRLYDRFYRRMFGDISTELV